MQLWLAQAYPWLRALHIISVISWMAGLLYLPRLFVYHCQVAVGSDTSELFKVMEYRLARYIMTPAMIASFVFGLALLGTPGTLARGGVSLLVKLGLVVLLSGTHLSLLSFRRDFARDKNAQSERFFRVLNEVPTVLMIGIVILIVVRPFF